MRNVSSFVVVGIAAFVGANTMQGRSSGNVQPPLPQGKVAVAYQSRPSSLYVTRLDGGGSRLLARMAGKIQAVVWSPHGDRLVVSFTPSPPGQARARILDNGGRVLGSLQGHVFPSSWSPDGRYVATDASPGPVCRNDAAPARKLRLRVYDSRGRLLHELPARSSPPLAGAKFAKITANIITAVAWSPAAHRLVYVVSEFDCANQRAGLGPSTLYAVNLADGRQTSLYGKSVSSSPASWWNSFGTPTWSPDGRAIAIVVGCLHGANGSGCSRVVVLRTDSRERAVLKPDPEDELAESVFWTAPDTLVFGKIRGVGISGIGMIEVRTKKPRWLIRARNDLESIVDYGAFRLSGDGRSVVSDATNSWPRTQVVVARLDGSRSWRIPYGHVSPSWGDQRDVYVP